jgi:hypothetical protein
MDSDFQMVISDGDIGRLLDGRRSIVLRARNRRRALNHGRGGGRAHHHGAGLCVAFRVSGRAAAAKRRRANANSRSRLTIKPLKTEAISWRFLPHCLQGWWRGSGRTRNSTSQQRGSKETRLLFTSRIKPAPFRLKKCYIFT